MIFMYFLVGVNDFHDLFHSVFIFICITRLPLVKRIDLFLWVLVSGETRAGERN